MVESTIEPAKVIKYLSVGSGHEDSDQRFREKELICSMSADRKVFRTKSPSPQSDFLGWYFSVIDRRCCRQADSNRS